MNWHVVYTIFRKELLDTLRDKRALVMMIGVPVILYPALLIVGSQATIMQMDKMRKTASNVALSREVPMVAQWLAQAEHIDLHTPDDPREALLRNELDAVIVVPDDFEAALAQDRTAAIELEYDSAEPASQIARERVQSVFREHGDELLHARLEKRDIAEEFITPITVQARNVAPPSKTTGAILGTALPVLLVVMLALGAFYPAIDLTAGEKERGTFESLLTTPISKLDIVVGKYITVCLLSLITGMLNLISMGLTFGFQLSQLRENLGAVELQLPPDKILLAFIIIVPLSLFIAAVMMSFAMFARTMKEAEFYLTPFLFIIMFPALLTAVPGAQLTTATQFVPITNVALLFKEIMTGTKGWESLFPVVLSTAIYAMLAILFAVWVFQREEVVLSEEKGIPLALRRRHFRPRLAPTPGMSLWLFGIALLLLFYVGSYVQQQNIWTGLLITQWLLFALPLVVLLWYVRIDIRNTLSLRLPSPAAFAASLLIGAAWVVIIVQVSFWQQKVLPMPDEMVEQMENLLAGHQQSVWVALFIVAVSPAICEELLFRGAILAGIRRAMPAWAAILVVGTLFGLMHISIYKIVATALSGIVLTYLVIRSGSIVTSMAAHFMVNGAAIVVSADVLPEWFTERLDVSALEERGVPLAVLAVAVAVFVAGAALMEAAARKPRRMRPEAQSQVAPD